MTNNGRETQGFAKNDTGCKNYDKSVPMMEKQNIGSGADYVL